MPRDPFEPAAWWGWGIVVLLLIGVPTACTISEAQEPQVPQEQRADGPAAAPDVRCVNGWCLVKQDTLKEFVIGLQRLDNHVRELRALCGWDRR